MYRRLPSSYRFRSFFSASDCCMLTISSRRKQRCGRSLRQRHRGFTCLAGMVANPRHDRREVSPRSRLDEVRARGGLGPAPARRGTRRHRGAARRCPRARASPGNPRTPVVVAPGARRSPRASRSRLLFRSRTIGRSPWSTIVASSVPVIWKAPSPTIAKGRPCRSAIPRPRHRDREAHRGIVTRGQEDLGPQLQPDEPAIADVGREAVFRGRSCSSAAMTSATWGPDRASPVSGGDLAWPWRAPGTAARPSLAGQPLRRASTTLPIARPS